ncbi:Cuticular protein 76Bd [Carabus blaptoides fortunei]
MIVDIDLLLWLTAVMNVVSGDYLLAKYAPRHENYEPIRYSYAYDVKDPSTGDHKHHWENRDGDAVQGEYGLIDPDGYMRTWLKQNLVMREFLSLMVLGQKPTCQAVLLAKRSTTLETQRPLGNRRNWLDS